MLCLQSTARLDSSQVGGAAWADVSAGPGLGGALGLSGAPGLGARLGPGVAVALGLGPGVAVALGLTLGQAGTTARGSALATRCRDW